jgi:hypothetical protein
MKVKDNCGKKNRRTAQALLAACVFVALNVSVLPSQVAAATKQSSKQAPRQSTNSSADVMYRYIGEQGEIVIDHYIPPEFVHKGYAVLNKSGAVIETVAPALTEEERALMSEQQKEEEAKKERAKADAWLLERYSDSSDAVRARDRQIGSLETMIVVAQSNINKLKDNEVRELGYAADAERQGKEVPKDVLKNIESIRDQIRNTEQQIAHNKAEQEKTRAVFEGIIFRLQEIERDRQTGR